MTAARRLKTLLAERRALTLPGAANAMFARVIEDCRVSRPATSPAPGSPTCISARPTSA
jgi:2-methylisocitrate lyase-like PEP mutase family enzyme